MAASIPELIFRLLLILSVAITLAGCPRNKPAPDPAPAADRDEVERPKREEDGRSHGGNHRDDSAARAASGEAASGGSGSLIADSELRRRLVELGSGDPRAINAASEHFASAYGDRGLEIFREHLDDPDAHVRRGALWGTLLGKAGGFDPHDARMAAAMHKALADDDPGVRHVALEALGGLERRVFFDFIEIEKIVRFLDRQHEPDPRNRALAARIFSRHRTASQAALPALGAVVRNDPDYNVRSASLHAIYNVARNAEEALPAPTYVLEHDEDPRLRRVAANRLGSYRAASAPAVPQLIAALADDAVPLRAPGDPLLGTDEPVSIAAANALARIGKPAVGALLQSMRSDRRDVRLLSIRALGDIGPTAKDAAAELGRLAASQDAGEATAAKAAIIRIQGP